MNPRIPSREQARTRALDRLIKQRRDLHRHPEVGWTEFRTTALVVAELVAAGFDVTFGRELYDGAPRIGLPPLESIEAAWEAARDDGVPNAVLDPMRGGFTGAVGRLDTGRPGPVLAMRFDLDGLPLQESRDEHHRPARLGFGSVHDGVMHACGHDGHTAAGLAVARAAEVLASDLCGELRLFFQPAEEGVRGGQALASGSALDGVTHLIAFHLGLTAPTTGQVVAGATDLLGTEKLRIRFTGERSHAALAPEGGRHALLAAATAALGVHAIGPHSAGPTRANVGLLRSGTSANIIPEKAEMRLELRASHDAALAWLRDRTRAVLEGAATAYGCEVEQEVVGRATIGNSDATLAAVVADAARRVPGLREIVDARTFGASDDAADLMTATQERGGLATMTLVGADLAGAHHTDTFDFDEAGLVHLVDLATECVIEVLG
ncbi:amidohydrolase [Nocardioides carbamazepini]|uniref:amidohydrolase n=1 Tax=Nocardioides carbamazepini TaxID=2854259 RepID=UPI00214A76DF|nr:amidohydrolase [Nocardioides carbamazepini]MCR1782361.1 amidohydrolase [Nocardioides carbamazepini]